MNKNNKTFWELICEYKINIPIIQRDYAQGRETEEEKRDFFLDVIYEYLTNENPEKLNLSLDFIYGKITNQLFLPIDGQQRLTTLFLLHWYMLKREDITNPKFIELKNFEYDTRISSREFCVALVDEEINIPSTAKENKLKENIKNSHWYRRKWDKDPTIVSMLNMIQAIHQKFHNVHSELLHKRLIIERAITFQLLDLGKKGFELTDELYIKMNARGKELTSFENFKANFIQFIEKEFKNSKKYHPDRKEISYSEYFSFKIEKEWTDLFWEYRGSEVVIDNLFLNYFSFISEILFFQENINANTDAFYNATKQYKTIFNKEENLLFLFDSLDKLHEISLINNNVDKTIISEFFNSFINSKNSTGDYINLFVDNIESNNLFGIVILEGRGADLNIKFLFYLILKYLIKYDAKTSSTELKDFVRVIRNLLQSIRQRNDTKYNSNIRINYWGDYWKVFKMLISCNIYETLLVTIDSSGSRITTNSLLHEKSKAELIIAYNKIKPLIHDLEEFKHFKGLIHILEPKQNTSKLNDYKNALKEIWDSNISDIIIIQALIVNGFRGLYTKNCNMGDMWFFGKNKAWNTILTINKEKDDLGKVLLSFLDNYLSRSETTAEEKLCGLIDDWKKDNEDNRSWKYYFIKYSTFTSSYNYFVKPHDFTARMLGTDGSNPLVALHISPYVSAVCKSINNTTICDEKDSKKQYTGNFPLLLKNGVAFTSTNKGWIIENANFNPETINNFKLEAEEEEIYLLREIDERDRIEIAVDLIKEII